MRMTLAALLVATPALSWEFTPLPVCTLSETAAAAEVTVTYDHATDLYAIEVLRPGGWPAAPVFAIRFEGPQGLTITTDRHQISPDGTRLTVTDTGFGNVLNGLAFNTRAVAILGETEAAVPLAGAAAEVEAFRACTQALAV